MKKTPKKNQRREKKPPVKMGRPTKMTPEVVQKLREVFLLDYTIEEACDHAGIAKQTYYNEMKDNPDFVDEMDKAQRGLFKAAKRAIAIEIIEKKNAGVSLNFLKHRQSERYRTKNETDMPMVGNITMILPGSKAHPRIIPEEDL